MAEQVGNIVIVGTNDSLCFYEMQGKYYVRMKPGPDRKQFLKNARYKPQREAHGRMMKSARVTSALYGLLDQKVKGKEVYNALQKRANYGFKGEMKTEEVIGYLVDHLVTEKVIKEKEMKAFVEQVKEVVGKQARTLPRKPYDVDHFSGVRIKTKDGRWFRLYHRDELRLLEQYCDRIHEGDETWLSEFLVRRKGLTSYRLTHKWRRRRKTLPKQLAPNCVSTYHESAAINQKAVGNKLTLRKKQLQRQLKPFDLVDQRYYRQDMLAIHLPPRPS